MKYLDLDGRSCPALGFGTHQLNGVTGRTAVVKALEVGYRHFDTARAYENERDVGGALRESGISREDLFVTTKIDFHDLSPNGVRSQLEQSLRELDTDYVDLLLIHWPNPEFPLKATLAEMEKQKEAGRVRAIGVSNFTPELIEEAESVASIACNQVEYHPLLGQEQLLEMARRHGFVLTAYSPLAQGKAIQEDVVREIAERLNREPAQVVLRWLLQQENVAAIPRSSEPGHIASNLEVFDFDLDENDMDRIAALARNERQVDPSWAPEWTH